MYFQIFFLIQILIFTRFKMANMKTTKNAYLEKLTRQIQMKSVKVGKNLEGSTPPSVFIGRWSYPKVYAGPMMANQVGNTAIMDSPESWIGQHKNQEDIINYRMSLVRGKQLIKLMIWTIHLLKNCKTYLWLLKLLIAKLHLVNVRQELY